MPLYFGIFSLVEQMIQQVSSVCTPLHWAAENPTFCLANSFYFDKIFNVITKIY